MIEMIDDIAFEKKRMHSAQWGLSRETISLLYLQHIIFTVGFCFVLSPNQYHNALQKA